MKLAGFGRALGVGRIAILNQGPNPVNHNSEVRGSNESGLQLLEDSF